MNTNTTTTGAVNGQSTTAMTIIPKPSRNDFYKSIVINGNGAIIPESEWLAKVDPTASGRVLTNQLHKLGLVKTHSFDVAGFDAARASYVMSKTNMRNQLISEAFSRLSISVEPQIKKALQDLLPLFKDVPPKKTVRVFKNLIHIIHSVHH